MRHVAIRPSLRSLKFSPTLLINERVAELRRAGNTVYHMGFGESPFPVHPTIRAAISDYSGKNQYMPAAGMAELRHAARDYILKKHRIGSDEFDVMVGPGSKELIFDIQLAVEGDLLFPAPSWVSYIPQTLITRDEVVRIHLGPGVSYKLSAAVLDDHIREGRRSGKHPTKLILNYPNNPTGMTYTPEELEEIAGVCRAHNILVISDEIYAQVAFRRYHRSIAHYYPEGTIVTTGLSKHLSLGGFRLGIALVPRGLGEVFQVLRAIASETFSAVSTPIQYSVLTAFQENTEIEPYITQCTEIHDVVTRYVWRTLQQLGVDYAEPQGGFYMYPDFEPYRRDLRERYGIDTSDDLARDLLHSRQVATLPSTAFGDSPRDLRLRLSTVDFDGLTALSRYGEMEGGAGEERRSRENRFVETACPRVAEGCRRLVQYVTGEDE
ncbi:MAG: pyridoxal phosphate-dependent aminotransferase [Alkalispirochaeta sp.]